MAFFLSDEDDDVKLKYEMKRDATSVENEYASLLPKRPNGNDSKPADVDLRPDPPNKSGKAGSICSERNHRRFISSERLCFLKKRVDAAVANRRTFTVNGGFNTVRNALIERGWVEKIEHRAAKSRSHSLCGQASVEDLCRDLPKRRDGEAMNAHVEKCEKTIMSRLLQHHYVDFYWNVKRDEYDWLNQLQKSQTVNRFCKSPFTSKEGLCSALRQMHWYNEHGVAYTRFPRCYNTAFHEQLSAFVDDYRLTACMSLLKWLVRTIEKEGELAVRSCEGKVPFSAIQFAINRCDEYVSVKNHEDIDREDRKTWDHEWENFLTNYNLVVHENKKFHDEKNVLLALLQMKAKNAIREIEKHWPQFTLDGMLNVWIVKPGNKCRGRGIQLMHNLHDIVMVTSVGKTRFVVQKYIERPFLIYNTKFDIRQWFLITSTQPLVIWIYKESYLRFSSQQFDLKNYHESIHLTNYAVQCRYKNCERDGSLPDENMWDCHTFKTYLRQIGVSDAWDKKIYPGMREAIVGAMLASQESMDRRANSFELYGADFMLMEDFSPWLIEINSSPDMAPSTSVTAQLCPRCLEDIIKVVIDRRDDPSADTGMFELLYRQHIPRAAAYLGLNLSVRGKRVYNPRRAARAKSYFTSTPSVRNGHERIPRALDDIEKYSGPVIEDLIEELQNHTKAARGELLPERKNGGPLTPSRKTTKNVHVDKKERKNLENLTFRPVSKNKRHLSDDDNNAKDRKENGAAKPQRERRPADVRANKKKTRSISLFDEWQTKVESTRSNASHGNRKASSFSTNTASILQSNVALGGRTSGAKPTVVRTACDGAGGRPRPRIETLFAKDATPMSFADKKNFYAIGLGLKSYDANEKLILPSSVHARQQFLINKNLNDRF